MEKYYLRKGHYNYEIVNEEDATLVALSKEDFEKLLKEYKAIIKSINYWAKRVTEKANSERGLSPAKHHSGYVLLQSNPFSLRYRSYGKSKEKIYYETILQTPYGTDTNSDIAMTTIINDLKEKRILEKLGLTNIREELTGSDVLLEKVIEEKEAESTAFNMRLRINGTSYRWDLVFNHIKVLDKVPWELKHPTRNESVIIQKTSEEVVESEADEEEDADEIET